MKHTEVPQNFDWTQLEWCDQLVFAQIKRFMNKETRQCYPSIKTLKDKTGLSSTFIKDSIERLEQFGLLHITRRHGTSNLYYFPPETDNFEMFSEPFLDLDLPPKVKEYYMKIQTTLFDKDQPISFTHYNDSQLASVTGLSRPTVKKYNQILIDKGIVHSELTQYKDSAGFSIREMSFDMEKLGQFGLWARKITEQVIENTDDINDLKECIKKQERRIKELERQANLNNAKEVDFEPYPF